MSVNTTYKGTPAETAARALLRAGLWDLALDMLAPGMTELRAQVLTERFWWCQDGAAEAEKAVAELAEEDPVLGGFYAAQLAYARVLFGLDPRPDDTERTRAGFGAALADRRLAGWAAFWLGVVADHFDHDPVRAAPHYARARDQALADGDLLLESYAVRHIGGHAVDRGDAAGLDQLWRSYHLRAALGARPQTAAAAALLAASLPAGAEAQRLRAIAAGTARELRLTWLASSLQADAG